MDEDLKDKPVVMFCTGGIRCEKASVVMMDAGFSNVKQLKGGILGYFEEVGGDYWNGDCFVFDRRVAVNPQLEETDVVQCFACREPLLVEEQSTGGVCNSAILSILFRQEVNHQMSHSSCNVNGLQRCNSIPETPLSATNTTNSSLPISEP